MNPEQIKYERMWDVKQYRKYSPGERILPEIQESLQMPEGSSIIDFGCGTGRAAQALYNQGYKVTGTDIAHNCLDTGMSFEFLVHDLTQPLEQEWDFGICTDVMEHIPTDDVDTVLENISNTAPVTYFQIAMFRDSFGKHIGERLHMTVQQADWWKSALLNHFSEVVIYSSKRDFKCKAVK